MPLRRMKQKKYKGIYELVNSTGLITGYYLNYCGADGKTKKTRAKSGNAEDAIVELATIVSSLNKARQSNSKAEILLKLGNGSLNAIASKYFDTLNGDINAKCREGGTARKTKSRWDLYLGSIHTKKSIKSEDVKLIVKELQSRELSNKTINDATDLLRTVLNFGVDNGYLPRDSYIMYKYKKLTVNNDMSVDAVLDPSQVRELFRLSLLNKEQHKQPSIHYEPTYPKLRLQFFLKMLYFTGQRPKSILRLQKQDISKDYITISTIKKQGKHYVAIADALIEDLNKWIKDLSPSDYLFSAEHDKSKPISNDSMSDTAKFLFSLYNTGKDFKTNRDTWISFYTLRHSSATNILASTGSMELAQNLLNHSSSRMTQKYAKLLQADKKRAVNVL